MHLGAFAIAGPVMGNFGAWRYPAADKNITELEYYIKLGRILEEGRFDLVFFPDVQAVADTYGGSIDAQLRYGALGSLRMDPLLVLSGMAAATSRLGLTGTISTTYFEPFDVARKLATLDHLSKGRAGWNIVTSIMNAEGANYGRSQHIPREQRYERADEFVELACKLWSSWQPDAVVYDRDEPLFADPSKVAPVNHVGKWFNVKGPLNVSRPPQGRPVFAQAGASPRGRDFSAKWADIIFVNHSSLEAAQAFYADIKDRARRFGRNPDDIKILPGIIPIVGETELIARERDRLLEELMPTIGGLSTLSYHLDVDLSVFPHDEVLPKLDVPGIQGHYDEVSQLTHKSGLSLGELGKRYGVGTVRDFVGTAEQVVARLEEWYDGRACDGFMIQIPYFPGGIEDFVRLVVPVLQSRGRFRKEYSGTTLRDHLGIPFRG